MSKVFLITGFSNWGKTRLLKDLFEVGAFRKGCAHTFAEFPFLVMPQSNDDLGKNGYKYEFNDRLTKYTEVNGRPSYIASAFCPTQEKGNDSISILNSLYKNDQIEILLLEYKWCDHAKLNIPEIKNYYSTLPNVTVHIVSSRTQNGKLDGARKILTSLLP